MSERKRLRAELQRGPRPRSPAKEAVELILSGRRRLGLGRLKPSNGGPPRQALHLARVEQPASPKRQVRSPMQPQVPTRGGAILSASAVGSTREVRAAVAVERLLAQARTGSMSEEQLQCELEAARAEGATVPRHWLGQVRSAMKTAEWIEKQKLAPGLGKKLITTEAIAPGDLEQCEAQLEFELAIDMPQDLTARLALEERLRQEMAALLGADVEQLAGVQLHVAHPLKHYESCDVLTFTRTHRDIQLCAGGSEATKFAIDPADQLSSRTAAAEVVMQRGQHFAEFTIVEGRDLYFGVIRPGWDVEGGKNAQNQPEHCFYYAVNGACYPERNQDWVGARGLDGSPHTCVGLLIDLDVGSMTVYLNGNRVGAMVEGEEQQGRVLRGPYCWAVSMRYSHDTVRINKSKPGSTDGEELY